MLGGGGQVEAGQMKWMRAEDCVLTWDLRVKILRDCAAALKYLHYHMSGCIVHRDIKLTNILLTYDLAAKLSDFELSKMLGMEESKVFTDVRGTIGYMDPEYMAKDVSMGSRPLSDFLDPRIEDVNNVDFESILQIVVLCTASSSTGRPTIDLVFDEMERAWRNTQAEILRARKERSLSDSSPSNSPQFIYV
ncbi:hypothetical protein C2S52_023371 [Perilla frutescens var. hirtella]|nr:hypothetical protein C2S52_023371 [Perilla frutescens var. hirtella]